jgi:carboxyl-terminal processing protease
MQRDQINIPSVRSEMMVGQIGYLRISQFQEQTATELIKHLQALHKQGAKAWLLDLRNNPGGLVNSGVAVADAFLGKGTIVSIRARHEDGHLDYSADVKDHSKQLPTLVLINQGSASAAEIVAAALQENQRAKLAGQTSFGKGSVQSVISLDEERSIKLTTAYYFTPRGYNLNNNGIKPDYKFSDAITNEAALEKALDLLQKQL